MIKWAPYLTKEDLYPTPDDLALISALAYNSDDLADKMAEAILHDPSLTPQLEQALACGLEDLDNPPKIVSDFLTYYAKLPDKIAQYRSDSSHQDHSRSSHSRLGFDNQLTQIIANGLAISIGFFIGANYPSVGRSLVTTGSVAGSCLRMKQTMKFFEDVSHTKAFEKNGIGIQACAKVRLAHAFARRQIVKKGGWNEAYYGVPVSEFDNMIFLSGLFMSSMFQSSGMVPNAQRRVRGIQYGPGVPHKLLDLSPKEISRFFVMYLAHLDDSPETALQVVNNFNENDYFHPTNTRTEKINRELSLAVANLASRVLYGNSMADSIGLRRWYRGAYLPLLANSSRIFTTFAIGRQSQFLRIYAAANRLIDIATPRTNSNSAIIRDKQKTAIPKYKGSYCMFKGLK